jgi:hypothetical protein
MMQVHWLRQPVTADDVPWRLTCFLFLWCLSTRALLCLCTPDSILLV